MLLSLCTAPLRHKGTPNFVTILLNLNIALRGPDLNHGRGERAAADALHLEQGGIYIVTVDVYTVITSSCVDLIPIRNALHALRVRALGQSPWRMRSRCSSFRTPMVSEEQLTNLFCESTSHILTLTEIRQWCRNKELDDSDLEVS